MTSAGRQRKRFILVGCGSWGARWYNTFIPQARDIAECIAVVDLDEHCADLAGHALSIPPERRYTSVRRAFLENKVDFAVIAVSIPAHLTVIKTVLEVQPGCHILSEKPVAGSMFECRQIEALVRAAGIKRAFTFSHRYEQDKQSLEKLLASGKYGSIDSIVGRLIVKKQPADRADEMLLINGGCQYIDMLEVFAGSTWKSVYAQIWEHAWEQRGGTSHNAFLMCEMQNGVHVALEILLGSADDRNGWCNENFRIECDRACIEAESGELFERYTDENGERIVKKIPLEEGKHWKHEKTPSRLIQTNETFGKTQKDAF